MSNVKKKKQQIKKLNVVVPYLHPGQQKILEALKNHRFVVVAFGRRAGKSFPVGERILLSSGAVKRVESLLGKVDFVPAFFGKDTFAFTSAQAHFDKLPLQDIYQVKTCYGYTYNRTADHPFLTVDGWKQAKDLTDSDYIYTVTWLPIMGTLHESPRKILKLLKHPDNASLKVLLQLNKAGTQIVAKRLRRKFGKRVPDVADPWLLRLLYLKVNRFIVTDGCRIYYLKTKKPVIHDRVCDVTYIGKKPAVGISTSTKTLVTPALEHNTTGGTIIMLMWALSWKNQVIWWIAPTRSIAKLSWRLFLRMCPREIIKDMNKQDLMVELINGSTIWWKSGDRPANLLGEGLNLAIIDEAAEVKEEVWTEIIRPALADKLGSAILMSRPHGANWFYEEYLRGLPDEKGRTKDPEYISLRMESRENPFFPKSEWEKAKRQLPRAVFDQEFRAIFSAGASAVFSTVDECLVSEIVPAHGRKFMGVDPGRHRDFSAIVILDLKRQVVFARAWRAMPFTVLKQKIERLARDWDAEIWIDTHVIGSGLEDFLRTSDVAARLRPYPVKSSQIRRDLIEELAIAMDPALSSPHVVIPAGKNLDFIMPDGEHYHELYRELRDMDYKVTSSGEVKYEPGLGGHDDMVIALALANWGLKDRMGRVYSATRYIPSIELPQVTRRRTFSRKYSSRYTRRGL